MNTKYPDLSVRLLGRGGSALAAPVAVDVAMREPGVPEANIRRFMAEATSGDYMVLLRTCLCWVSVLSLLLALALPLNAQENKSLLEEKCDVCTARALLLVNKLARAKSISENAATTVAAALRNL